MKNLYFDNFEDLAYAIADKFDELNTENYEDIAVIAKYDEVKEVFKELVHIGYDICGITLDIPDKYGYNDEYILGLSNDGIWIEKFKRKNGYFEDESTVIYILDNCSSKVIPYCKGKTIYEVTVDEYEAEDCDFDCDECECACQKEKNPTTSSTKSTYQINNKEVTKDEFDKEFEKLEEKYLDNIRDMLLDYCEFLDEMNEWRRLFRW